MLLIVMMKKMFSKGHLIFVSVISKKLKFYDIDLIDTIVKQGCVTLCGYVQQILCKVLFR